MNNLQMFVICVTSLVTLLGLGSLVWASGTKKEPEAHKEPTYRIIQILNNDFWTGSDVVFKVQVKVWYGWSTLKESYSESSAERFLDTYVGNPSFEREALVQYYDHKGNHLK